MTAKRQRFALTVSVTVITVLLAALMPWSGITDKQKQTIAGAVETVCQPTVVHIPLSGTTAEYMPDMAEVEALAKMLYGEARGIASDMEKAACVWCVLNRVDNPRFPDTVLEVLTAPYQFAGYSADHPAMEELKAIAADVLTRYHKEKIGADNVGRVLPAEYLYFTGDGKNNHFTIGWKDTEVWQWYLSNPYED